MELHGHPGYSDCANCARSVAWERLQRNVPRKEERNGQGQAHTVRLHKTFGRRRGADRPRRWLCQRFDDALQLVPDAENEIRQRDRSPGGSRHFRMWAGR